MKKKIIIGLIVFSLIYLVAGFYILTTKERSCAKLDNLVKLHRIEILRGHLLIHIKGAQSDLQLSDETGVARADTFDSHISVMNTILETCFNCHHLEHVSGKLKDIKGQIDRFQKTAFAASTLRGSRAGLEAEHAAVQTGSRLIAEVDELTTMTTKKLDERTDAALTDIRHTDRLMYVLLAVVPFVAAGFAAVFIPGFTRPVNELLLATRRVRSGDLDYRIGRLQDEFGEVASSFNDMAANLKEHCLRMQWAEQLVLLGELSGGLAHEMKNPLAGIKVSMNVISRDPSLSVENREALVKVLDQIRRMERLLKNLLDIAKPPKLQIMPVQVNGILEAAVGVASKHPSFFAAGSRKSITIEISCDPHLQTIMADPFQLQQVFMNLMINAAEAMPQGGKVTVRTASDLPARDLLVIVADTGPGFDEDLRDMIFRPFFTTKANGTGLGLAISKRLVEQHGGSIHAENQRGGGAAFTVRLPLSGNAEVRGV